MRKYIWFRLEILTLFYLLLIVNNMNFFLEKYKISEDLKSRMRYDTLKTKNRKKMQYFFSI